MKREAVNHTKMKRLCRRLDIPTYQGVGLLESIWHLTARETPRGDIGRLSNEDIALGIDWRGDEDALIQGLVLSGWVDELPEHRLVVHDWWEHADSYVHAAMAKRLLLFADGRPPRIPHDAFDARTRGRIREQYREKHGLVPGESFNPTITPGEVQETPGELPTIPVPVPVPVPETSSRNQKPAAAPSAPIPFPQRGDDFFEKIYSRHPKKKDRGLAQTNLSQSAAESDFDSAEFNRVHELWCFEWAKEKPGFAPTLAQWILDQGWRYPPAESLAIAGPGPPHMSARDKALRDELMRD